MSWKAYLEYKQSGVEWLGDVPEHWIYGRLGDYVKLINGFPFDSQNFDREVGTPLIRIRDILNNFTEVNWAGKDITEAAVRAGDILIGMDGDFNVAWWSGPRAMLNQRVCCLRAKDILNQRYLFYLVGYPLRVINDVTYATTVKHLSSFDVLKIRLLLPRYSEQTAIAAFLDRETARIDFLIEKKQRQIELLQEKRSALISHAVTKGLDPNVKMKDSGVEWLGEIPEHWEVKSIRRIAKAVKTGGTPAGAEEMHFDQTGFNWYTPSDFHVDVTLSGSSRRLSEIGKKEVRLFPAMTVMMVGIGATIGKVALSLEPSSCNQQINAIVCNSKMTPKFLTYLLRIMRAYIFRCGKFTTLPIINQEDTKALIITCPPLPEQDVIVSILDNETERTDALIGKIQMSIDKLREYRTALISAAVTGKIDVRKEVS